MVEQDDSFKRVLSTLVNDLRRKLSDQAEDRSAGADEAWLPLERAALYPPEDWPAYAKLHTCSVAKAKKEWAEKSPTWQVWVNDVYEVTVRPNPGNDGSANDMVNMAITRHDGAPCHNWADFQWIKNQILGPECEAVELYPAESRKVDIDNTYWLTGYTSPKQKFAWGFWQRYGR